MANPAMLAAIFAAPLDDRPRQVHADALVEAGDPRGELIRVQLELATSTRARAAALEKRSSALLRKHEAGWLRPIRAHLRSWTWRRGFLDSIETTGDRWLAGAAAILDAHPVRAVKLTSVDEPREVLAMPELERIAALDLPYADLGNDDLEWVARSGRVRGLAALGLSSNRISDSGVIALAATPFAALEVLDLSWSKIGAKGMEALISAPFFPRLKSLLLAGAARLAAVKVLARAPLAAGALVDLSRNHYRAASTDVVDALVGPGSKLPRLRLDFRTNYAPPAEIARLAKRFQLVR
jgi:uncharacterized protein (TIGR02996 family)